MKRILILIGTLLATFIVAGVIISGIVGNHGSTTKWICTALAMIIIAALYVLPIIIAIKRKSPNLTIVIILTLFFGWTLFGWVIALLKAIQNTQKVNLYVKNK